MLKLCIVGTGYVGFVTDICLSDIGHKVICCDTDKEKLLYDTIGLGNNIL